MGISTGNESITYHVPAANVLLGTPECNQNIVDEIHLNFTLPGTLVRMGGANDQKGIDKFI